MGVAEKSEMGTSEVGPRNPCHWLIALEIQITCREPGITCEHKCGIGKIRSLLLVYVYWIDTHAWKDGDKGSGL